MPTTVIQAEVEGDALISIRRAPHLRIDKPLLRSGLIASMTVAGFAIYVAISAYTSADGIGTVSLDQLAADTGLSRRSVSRAMAVLIAEEWVERLDSLGQKSTYNLRPLTPATPPNSGMTPPSNLAQAVNKPGPRAAHICNPVSVEDTATGDLFADSPPPPVDAAAVALLLKLGMDRAWVDQHGHLYDLERVSQARDYAQRRCKPGGFLGYLRRTLEEGWGPKARKATAQTPQPPGQAAVPPVLATPDPSVDLLHPQNRPGSNAAAAAEGAANFLRKHEKRMKSMGLESKWEVPNGNAV